MNCPSDYQYLAYTDVTVRIGTHFYTMDNVIDFTQKYSYEFILKPPKTLDYEEYNVDWFLTPRGDMMCRRGGYEISSDILDREHWLWFLAEKRWFDANTFLPAYTEACRRAGVNQVIFNIK